MIQRSYRIDGEPGKRGVMGVSNGGLISLATVFSHPELFGCVAGQSSTIAPQLFDLATCDLATPQRLRPTKIYFDVGRYDLEDPTGTWQFLRSNREFHLELERRGAPHLYHEFNEGHQWANWRRRTAEILLYFFGAK